MSKHRTFPALLLVPVLGAAALAGLLRAVPSLAEGSVPRTNDPGMRQSYSFSPLRKVDLLSLDAGVRGVMKMGFLVDLEPGWHLYWANPGDAGLAPAVRWTLPPGFSAGPLLHPVPEKTVAEGLVTYGHSGTVLLLCEITLPPSYDAAATWEADAVLEWMACEESCIVGETALRIDRPPEAESVRRDRSVAESFAASFPRPLSGSGITASTGRAEWTGSAWRIEIALSGPRAGEVDDFFPYPIEGYVIENGGVSCGDEKILLPVVPTGGKGSPPPEKVQGLLIIGGTGYEITALVTPKASELFPPWRSNHE
jgi:DsbC/DsbD-like thiol-disulfide interchange protein